MYHNYRNIPTVRPLLTCRRPDARHGRCLLVQALVDDLLAHVDLGVVPDCFCVDWSAAPKFDVECLVELVDQRGTLVRDFFALGGVALLVTNATFVTTVPKHVAPFADMGNGVSHRGHLEADRRGAGNLGVAVHSAFAVDSTSRHRQLKQEYTLAMEKVSASRLAERCVLLIGRAYAQCLPYVEKKRDGVWDDPEGLEPQMLAIWRDYRNYPLLTAKEETESSMYLRPSLEGSTHEGVDTGTCLLDQLSVVLCYCLVARKPDLRYVDPPDEVEAINCQDELKRRIQMITDPSREQFGDIEEFQNQCARVVVYYASSGHVTYTFFTPTEEYEQVRMKPSNHEENMRMRDGMAQADRDIHDRRLQRIAKEAEEFRQRVANGEEVSPEDRQGSRILFHPDVFANYVCRFFAEYCFPDKFESMHDVFEPCEEAMAYYGEVCTRVNGLLDNTYLDDGGELFVELLACAYEHGVTTTTNFCRRHVVEHTQVLSFDSYADDQPRETVVELKEALAEQARVLKTGQSAVNPDLRVSGENGPRQDVHVAWLVMAWDRLMFEFGNFSFCRMHLVTARDLVYSTEELSRVFEDMSGVLRNPYVVSYGGEWFVQAPCLEEKKPLLFKCGRDFCMAIATWCWLIMDVYPEKHRVLRTGARLTDVIQLALGRDVPDERHVSERERGIMGVLAALPTSASNTLSTHDEQQICNGIQRIGLRSGDYEPTVGETWTPEARGQHAHEQGGQDFGPHDNGRDAGTIQPGDGSGQSEHIGRGGTEFDGSGHGWNPF